VDENAQSNDLATHTDKKVSGRRFVGGTTLTRRDGLCLSLRVFILLYFQTLLELLAKKSIALIHITLHLLERQTSLTL
jgi:hypothetical protein